MEVYFNGVPPRNSIDVLAEAREKRDAQVRAAMNKPAYLATIAESLIEAMLDKSTPLGELVDMLFDAPIRDVFDLRAFETMRDCQRLGRSILHIVAMVSLEAYETESGLIGF